MHFKSVSWFCLFTALFWGSSSITLASVSTSAVNADPLDDVITQGVVSYQLGQQSKQMLALDTQVEMTVSGLINRVTVKQVFNNVEDSWINAKYVFPLPDNAAVDGMSLLIGDRVIEGMIKPKAVAKQQFEQAKKQGKQASLVSQQRPNVFTTHLANIGPQQQIVVEITYLQTINYQDGVFSLRFPLVVAPRYRPSGQISLFDESNKLISPRFSPVGYVNMQDKFEMDSHKVSIRVVLDAGTEIEQLTSLYHPIIQSKDGRKTNLSLAGKVPLDRDFVLQWQTSNHQQITSALFYQHSKSHPVLANGPTVDENRLQSIEKSPETYAMALLIPPTMTVKEQHKIHRELILVIDTSGSMAGESIIQAKMALDIALKDLDSKDSFNIIEFNSSVNPLFANAQPVSVNTLTQAKRFIGALHANGGTEMAGALNSALLTTLMPKQQESFSSTTPALRQVIFITDGAVSNEAQLFEQISYQLGESRLFTVGIGSAPNSHFMRRAANVGKGSFSYVGKASEVEQQISALIDKISQPVLTNIELHHLDGTVPDYWPANIDDLYQQDPLYISFKIPAGRVQPVIISGYINGQFWQHQLDFNQGSNAKGIDLVWANAQITELELSQNRAERQRVAKQVEALAMKYHLASSQTSLVAVDVTPVNPNTNNLLEKQVGLLLPAGWQIDSHGVLPQTSTASRLWLLMGASLLMLTILFGLWLKGALPGQRLSIIN
ncbi:marine proteobacterial sortase target protein [Shewanella aestuarii]|uniref:Marine proteobacterial sortase target protein n=1 Tax=Shewanella aestuarii TaxID=1028752 RepID=A0A6G9QLU8_9GAMM|nr:marine proteobacterial sortase target protein [Shewanella aestuarii]QIR14811.1 marine proteobacterial sortase target protein [Shewanella aestuarii]